MGAAFKLDKKNFSREVEDMVFGRKCTYMEAILALCEKHELEPDTVGKLITQPIKEKVQVEGQELNLLPKTNTLI